MTEQETMKSLLERVIDHQMNTDDKLREIRQRSTNTALDELLGTNAIFDRLQNCHNKNFDV